MILVCQLHSHVELARSTSTFLVAVWQLISLAAWVVDFLEDLMKECVFLADLAEPNQNLTLNSNSMMMKEEPMDDDPFLRNCEPLISSMALVYGPQAMNQPPRSAPLDAPILLHLAHPLALTNLTAVVSHVNRFHQYLTSMTPKQENSQYARDIMLDLVNSSGLVLKALENILSAAIPEASAIPSACISSIVYSLKP